MSKTVIVTVRHPDYGNDHDIFGSDVEIVDIDLGSQFDCVPEDVEQWEEWAGGFFAIAMRLHQEGCADAAVHIEKIVNEVKPKED